MVEVYFTYADRPYWWTRFLKTGFSHVYMMIPVEQGHVFISPNLNSLQIELIPIGHFLPKNLQKPAILVKYYTDVNPQSGCDEQFTCVETVKRFLGIKKRFIFTPYQLYRYLSWEVHQKPQSKHRHKKRLI